MKWHWTKHYPRSSCVFTLNDYLLKKLRNENTSIFTFVPTIVGTLLFFNVYLSFYLAFSLAWKTSFNISCSVDLLVTNSLDFWLKISLFYFLKSFFLAEYRILVFSFSFLKMPFHCPLVCTVSENKSLNNLIIFSQYVIAFSPLVSFKMLYF